MLTDTRTFTCWPWLHLVEQFVVVLEGVLEVALPVDDDTVEGDVSQTTLSRTSVALLTDIGWLVTVTFDWASQRNKPRAKAAFPAASFTVRMTEYIPGRDSVYDGNSSLMTIVYMCLCIFTYS